MALEPMRTSEAGAPSRSFSQSDGGAAPRRTGYLLILPLCSDTYTAELSAAALSALTASSHRRSCVFTSMTVTAPAPLGMATMLMEGFDGSVARGATDLRSMDHSSSLLVTL